MTKTDASKNPKEPGYYVVWLHMSDRPVVLYWGEHSTEWRAGAVKQRVDAWMGPLPK